MTRWSSAQSLEEDSYGRYITQFYRQGSKGEQHSRIGQDAGMPLSLVWHAFRIEVIRFSNRAMDVKNKFPEENAFTALRLISAFC